MYTVHIKTIHRRLDTYESKVDVAFRWIKGGIKFSCFQIGRSWNLVIKDKKGKVRSKTLKIVYGR